MTTQTSERLRGAVATRASSAPAQAENGQRKTIHDLINEQRYEIARALPKHMDADRLARVVVTTLKTNPRLLEATPQSLLAALMLSAQLGLEPGPLGHCYFVPFRNKGVMEITWILGYKGLIDLARRSGQLLSIEAREVCANDEFEFEYGLDEKLLHRPYMKGDRGPVVAFYGIARFKDGGRYLHVMSKSDVDARRARSKSADNGPWVTDYIAMGRKTVIRAMAPFLPLNVEAASALAADDKVHHDTVPDLDGLGPVVDVTPESPAIEQGEHVDEATGEVTSEPDGGWPEVAEPGTKSADA